MAFELPMDVYKSKLEDSALSLQHADQFKLEHLDNVTASQLLKQLPPNGANGAIRIPYYDTDGELAPYERVRWLGDLADDRDPKTGKLRKAGKYRQKKGEINRAYFTPGGWQGRTWGEIIASKDSICIVEGEFKAMSLHTVASFMPTIALAGVYNWRSKSRGTLILPELAKFVRPGRSIYILFDHDGDVTGKPKDEVLRAEVELFNVLAARDASPHICRIGRAGEGEKVAPDDLVRNKDVDRLLATIEASHARGPEQASPVMELLGCLYEMDGDFWEAKDNRFFTYSRAKVHYANRTVEYMDGDKPKRASAFDLYLRSPMRQSIRHTGLYPEESYVVDTANGSAGNQYRGLSVTPQEGDTTRWLSYLDGLVGESGDTASLYLRQWLAHLIQRPTERMSGSVILQGPQGVGKSLLGNIIGNILGWKSLGANFGLAAMVGPDVFKKGFNEYMDGSCFILIDELSHNVNDAEDLFKSYRTSDFVTIDRKYGAKTQARNHVNFMITTNRGFAVRTQAGARRDFILRVPRFWGEDQLSTFAPWALGPGAAAIAYDLLNYSLEGFDPRAPVPATKAQEEMAFNAMHDYEMELHDLLLGLGGYVAVRPLCQLIARRLEHSSGKVSEKAISNSLAEWGWQRLPPTKINGSALRGWTKLPVEEFDFGMNPDRADFHDWLKGEVDTFTKGMDAYQNQKF